MLRSENVRDDESLRRPGMASPAFAAVASRRVRFRVRVSIPSAGLEEIAEVWCACRVRVVVRDVVAFLCERYTFRGFFQKTKHVLIHDVSARNALATCFNRHPSTPTNKVFRQELIVC